MIVARDDGGISYCTEYGCIDGDDDGAISRQQVDRRGRGSTGQAFPRPDDLAEPDGGVQRCRLQPPHGRGRRMNTGAMVAAP